MTRSSRPLRRLIAALALLFIARIACGEALTLRVREQATIELIGVTAAYAVDPTVAEVVLAGPGKVMIRGNRVGSTQIVTVTPTTTASYLVIVAGEKMTAPPSDTMTTPAMRYSSRYVSEGGRFENAFDVFRHDGERLSEIHLINVHYFRDTFGHVKTSFPFAAYRVKTPKREFTILDDFVDVSPLTVTTTQIRGIHWLERGVEVHAGYAAPTMYEGLLLPVDRRWVGGASYSIERGQWRWIPTVYGFFTQRPNSSARRGTVASMISEFRSGGTLWSRNEVAVALGQASIGASTDFSYETQRNRLRARIAYKPKDFPTLGLMDIRGTRGQVFWNHLATDRLTVTGYSSYDHVRFGDSSTTSAFGNVGLRYSVNPSLAILSGIEATDFRGASSSIQSVAIPVGVTFDLPRFGAGVTYKTIEISNTSRRGDSLRFGMRVGGPALQLSAWGERERNAPTLDLIFREDPELKTALVNLGITVRSPEDLARVLRENAALINLGFITGVTVNLAPQHTLGGVDITWTNPWSPRDHFALHGIYDHVEGVRDVGDTRIGTVTYSRRIFESSDIYGSYSRWHSRNAFLDDHRSLYEVGVRTNVAEIPALFQTHGPIEGFVFFDPQMNGTFTDGATPLQGVAVSLDGVDSARTDNSGHYVFRGVSAGVHRVAAQLPPSKPAFFTTPSHVEVPAGSRVDFGLVYSPARLSGRVVSDANIGISGAVVTVTPKSGAPIRTTADPEGAFRLDLPAGDYRADLAIESLPPGYVVAGDTQRAVHLVADQPLMVSFVVQALRSIAGVTTPGAEVEIAPLEKKTVADATGSFVLRSLPAGTFKLTARAGGQAATKMVVLPDLPASMHDVNLILTGRPSPEPAMVASAPLGAFYVPVGAFRLLQNAEAARARIESLGLPADVRQSGSLQIVTSGPFATREEMERAAVRLRTGPVEAPPARAGAFAVQVGAFRDASNAAELLRRLRRLGMSVFTSVSRGLTLVRVGPFSSREAATAAAAQLRQAQFEAIVTPR